MAVTVDNNELTDFVTASDLIAGEHWQYVKLGSGAAGATTVINAGAGVAANALRATLASDDPAVVALQLIDNAIAGSEMQVDVVAALPAGTNAIGKLAANSGVDIGDVDVLSVPAPLNVVGNGGAVTALRVTMANDSTGIVAAAAAGNVAHDAGDSGSPVKVGHKALAHGANPTAVAAADRTDWYANRAGVPFVIGGHPNIVSREYVATSAQTDDPIVTVAAGLKIVVTEIEALVDNATTVDVGVRIGFGTANVPTVPTDGNTVDGMVLSHPGIAPGSGVVRGSGAGMLAVGADDQDLRITSEVPTTGSLRVLVSYYTIES